MYMININTHSRFIYIRITHCVCSRLTLFDMQIQSLSLDSFSEAEVETRVNMKKEEAR